MKNLAIIACVSCDGGLGKGNDLLWRFPEDQKFFRDTTMGATVVMGGKTFESIGRALPGRKNIVLSRDKIDAEGVEVFHNKVKLDKHLGTLPGKKFIIGGASLYGMYLPEVEEIFLTEVNAEKPADVFFPEFDRSLYDAEVLRTGEADGIKYQIKKYTRRTN